MRPRDPRRLSRRRRRALARVTLRPDGPEAKSSPDGSVGSRQEAEITLPRHDLERMWTPEYLERLAGTYWRYLTRITLGVLRVVYTPESREIAVLGRPLVLLRFHAPEYETEADCGTVTWRIDRGLLVAPSGRDRGYLRISVGRPRATPERIAQDEATVTVSSEVANFYPLLAGWGWFSRLGRILYRETQLRIHVVVTHAFLRSLANLDFAPSRVGALGEAQRPERAGRRAALG